MLDTAALYMSLYTSLLVHSQLFMQQLLTQPQPLMPASQGAAQAMHMGNDSSAVQHPPANNPWSAPLGARCEPIGDLTYQMRVGQNPQATAADLIELGCRITDGSALDEREADMMPSMLACSCHSHLVPIWMVLMKQLLHCHIKA